MPFTQAQCHCMHLSTGCQTPDQNRCSQRLCGSMAEQGCPSAQHTTFLVHCPLSCLILTASCSCVTPQLTALTFTLDPALGRVSRTKRLSDSACGTPLPLNRGRQPREAPAAGSGAITASAEGRRASPVASAVPLASRWLLPRLTLAPEVLRLRDRRFCRHQAGLHHPTIHPFSRLLCWCRSRVAKWPRRLRCFASAVATSQASAPPPPPPPPPPPHPSIAGHSPGMRACLASGQRPAVNRSC